ncbi:MAG: hypothetical protein IPJ65_19695 [Archangiaceae bacterium]|nr:hypothetical protein [Archangiaceae bacterium]
MGPLAADPSPVGPATLPGLEVAGRFSRGYLRDSARFAAVSAHRKLDLEGGKAAAQPTARATQPNLWGEVIETTSPPATAALQPAGAAALTPEDEGRRDRNLLLAEAYRWRYDIDLAPQTAALFAQRPLLREVLIGARAGALLEATTEQAQGLLALTTVAVNDHHLPLELLALGDGRYVLVNVAAFSAALPQEGVEADTVLGLARLAGTAADGPLRQALLETAQTTPEAKALSTCLTRLLAGETLSYERWPGLVEQLAVPTFDRPEQLEQALHGYLDGLKAYGRTHVEVTVFDDSSGEVAQRNQALVAELAVQGNPVKYFGAAQKRALLDALSPQRIGAAIGRTPEQTERLLSVAFGSEKADGTWAGSIASQRDWVALLSAGARWLVVDDDTQPGAYAVVEQPRSEALEPRTLVEQYQLRDTVGLGEQQVDGLVAAHFTGHRDVPASQPLRWLLDSADHPRALQGELPLYSSADSASHFSGSTYVTPRTLAGIIAAPMVGRDEDFVMAKVAAGTSRGSVPTLRGTPDFVQHHRRGPRWTNPAQALWQEAASEPLTSRLGADLAAFNEQHERFDAVAFRDFALARFAQSRPELDAHADRARASGAQWHLRLVELSERLDELLTHFDAGATGAELAEYRSFEASMTRPELRSFIALRRDEARRAAGDFLAEFSLAPEADSDARGAEAFRARFVAHGEANHLDVLEGIPLMVAAQRELARAAYEAL